MFMVMVVVPFVAHGAMMTRKARCSTSTTAQLRLLQTPGETSRSPGDVKEAEVTGE
jgi:hypothetical protein